MTERDDHLAEGFLVDGVAPSVIGGDENPGPPIEEDHEDFRPDVRREDFRPGTRREPPTTPIPAQQTQIRVHGLPPEQQQAPEQRKGWLGRVFGPRE
jgi:hypothetical protein